MVSFTCRISTCKIVSDVWGRVNADYRIALPHAEVEVRNYYKYIDQSLIEPRRMKQLLTWCGSRALPEKPSGDVKNANAIMAARAIQQELIDDFASKPQISDWFSRVRSPICVKTAAMTNERCRKILRPRLSLENRIHKTKRTRQCYKNWRPRLNGTL